MVDFSKVLDDAVEAAKAEALRIWNADGQKDCGCCGGAVMMFDGRNKLTKVAIEKGLASPGTDKFLRYIAIMPEEIRSQNREIEIGAARAFKKTLDDAGLGNAIKKFWTYVD